MQARSERVAERIEERHRRRAEARGRTTDRSSRWSAEEKARQASALAARAANSRVVGSVLIAIGANWLLMELGLFPFGLSGLLAVGLAVLGLGLIGTAKAGPPGKLLLIGVLMTAMLAMSGGVAAQVQFSFPGDKAFVPASVVDLRDEYQLDVGDLMLDLSDVEFSREPRRVRAAVHVGDLTVRVPRDVSVRATGRVKGAGSINLFGQTSEGLGGVEQRHEDEAFRPATRRVILDLSASLGDIVVERVR